MYHPHYPGGLLDQINRMEKLLERIAEAVAPVDVEEMIDPLLRAGREPTRQELESRGYRFVDMLALLRKIRGSDVPSTSDEQPCASPDLRPEEV